MMTQVTKTRTDTVCYDFDRCSHECEHHDDGMYTECRLTGCIRDFKYGCILGNTPEKIIYRTKYCLKTFGMPTYCLKCNFQTNNADDFHDGLCPECGAE